MLLDTSGLMCVLDKQDWRHAEAVRHYQSARVRLVTNYVLAEYVALAHVRGMSRQQTLAFSDAVLRDPNVEIVWVENLFIVRRSICYRRAVTKNIRSVTRSALC